MVCGGFTCSKNALIILNIFYLIVGCILVGVGGYARLAAVITSVSVVGGLIACGVFLWLISFMGFYGACKHNQVILFFYMLVLLVLFLIQFSVAVASMVSTKDNRDILLSQAWKKSSNTTRVDIMKSLQCCGFKEVNLVNHSPDDLDHPPCIEAKLSCCNGPAGKRATCCVGSSNSSSEDCPCKDTCYKLATGKLEAALKVAGGIGLFFSFTEIIGVWLALRYRNQRDPKINPSDFL